MTLIVYHIDLAMTHHVIIPIQDGELLPIGAVQPLVRLSDHYKLVVVVDSVLGLGECVVTQ